MIILFKSHDGRTVLSLDSYSKGKFELVAETTGLNEKAVFLGDHFSADDIVAIGEKMIDFARNGLKFDL